MKPVMKPRRGYEKEHRARLRGHRPDHRTETSARSGHHLICTTSERVEPSRGGKSTSPARASRVARAESRARSHGLRAPPCARKRIMRLWVVSFAVLLLVGLLASCGERTDDVGCLVSVEHGSTLVAPDAPFAVRYKAVREQVRSVNGPTLAVAAACAANPGPYCKQAPAERRAQCTLTAADDATCAWINDLHLFSRDPPEQAILKDTCRCLGLDAEWCDAAIHDGEEQAALEIARRKDRLAYISACSRRNLRPCWWRLRELLGYPVDGPAVTDCHWRALAARVAAGASRPK